MFGFRGEWNELRSSIVEYVLCLYGRRDTLLVATVIVLHNVAQFVVVIERSESSNFFFLL